MENVVFWDVKFQLVPHRKHITSLKNGVFWDVTPCDSCKNRLLEELSASFIRVTKH
jgi:hypothetical protein